MSRQWCGLGYKAFALRMRQLDAWDLAPILKVQNRTALQVHATGNGIVLGEKLQLQNFQPIFCPCLKALLTLQYVAICCTHCNPFYQNHEFRWKTAEKRKKRQSTTCNGALAQSLPKVCPNFSKTALHDSLWLCHQSPRRSGPCIRGDSRACSDSYWYAQYRKYRKYRKYRHKWHKFIYCVIHA